MKYIDGRQNFVELLVKAKCNDESSMAVDKLLVTESSADDEYRT